MITSGRIIETDFGHLFDEIIINLSQDQTQRVSFKVIRVSKRYKIADSLQVTVNSNRNIFLRCVGLYFNDNT